MVLQEFNIRYKATSRPNLHLGCGPVLTVRRHHVVLREKQGTREHQASREQETGSRCGQIPD